MNTIIKKIGFLTGIIVLLGFAGGAQAQSAETDLPGMIDVEFDSGININGDKIFDVEGIAPGQKVTKNIQIQNKHASDEVRLYMWFDVKGDKFLADELKIYVIRDDGSYRVGGSGDHYTLAGANDEDYLYINRLDPGESEKYKVRVKLDEEAGNEYQGEETRFHIKFKIEQVEDEATDDEVFDAQGRTVSGNEPEVAGATTTATETGTSSEGQNGRVVGLTKTVEGAVAGVQSVCQGWPLWAWIILLVVTIGIVLLIGSGASALHLFWHLVPVIAAVVLWYFFDQCREHTWFLYTLGFVWLITEIILYTIARKKIDSNQ